MISNFTLLVHLVPHARARLIIRKKITKRHFLKILIDLQEARNDQADKLLKPIALSNDKGKIKKQWRGCSFPAHC